MVRWFGRVNEGERVECSYKRGEVEEKGDRMLLADELPTIPLDSPPSADATDVTEHPFPLRRGCSLPEIHTGRPVSRPSRFLGLPLGVPS